MSSQKKGVYGAVDSKKNGRWDMEEMEKRAKERAVVEKELQEEDDLRALGKAVKKAKKKEATEEDIAAEKSERIVFESAVGKTQVIQGGPNARAPGFYCRVCDCVLKDSTAYMDHKNGKKHLKNLGVDTKVVREDVSDVIAKLESMKRKAQEPKKTKYEIMQQEERERVEKRALKKQKKNEKKAEEADDGGMDPEMAAMMGFSGFGSSKA